MSTSLSSRPAPWSLPSIGPLLSMADGARERGELEQALAGYKAALMVSDPAEKRGRADIYVRIAELKEAQGRANEAEHNFEKALSVDPENIPASIAVAKFAEAAGTTERALALLQRVSKGAPERDARLSAHVRIADLMATKLSDHEGAARALEEACQEHPIPLGLLARLRDLYEEMEAWTPLDRTFERLVERYAQLGDVESAWASCRHLAELRTQSTNNVEGAIEAWRGALRCKPDDMDAKERLARFFISLGDLDAAYEQLELAVLDSPPRPVAHSLLFAVHTRRGAADRAWLSAVALETLGALDLDAELVVGQYRRETPVRAETAVGESGWKEGLLADGIDPFVTGVLSAIGPAAIRARLLDLRAEKKLLALDASRQQPPTSTVSAVRSFVWAGQVLGIPVPDLFVLDDVPGGVAAVAAEAPSTALGPSVLKGLTAKRLAFVAGRHLTYYRPEFYPLVFFPSVPELRTLLLAAIALGLPELGASAPGEALRLSSHIAKVIDEEERARVAAAVMAFDENGGKTDLVPWVRGVELTAARAGLLLAGDLASAVLHVQEEDRHVGDLSPGARRSDLVAYSVSPRYATLRERLGIAAKG